MIRNAFETKSDPLLYAWVCDQCLGTQ